MNEELKTRVAKKLRVSEDSLIWSDICDNPETQRKNQELKTFEYDKGYFVLR